MADRFVKLKRTVDGFQRPIPVHQRTDASARGAGLRAAQPLRPHEGEPFRRGLSHRSPQGVTGQFEIVEPRILLQQGTKVDSQPVRQSQKRLPFLFAQLFPCHTSFILEPCSFLPGASHFSQLPLKDTKLLGNLLLTFLSIFALSAIALMHPIQNFLGISY
jgi:hypothetical protein